MSDKYKTMRHVVEENLVVGKICDICRKEIMPTSVSPRGCSLHNTPFFEITTGHHDWGNDSVDSIEIKHACSPECLMKFVGKYVTRDFAGYNTDYIDIEHVSGWHLPKEAKK